MDVHFIAMWQYTLFSTEKSNVKSLRRPFSKVMDGHVDFLHREQAKTTPIMHTVDIYTTFLSF